MGTRPLRHFYEDDVSLLADESLGDVVKPWVRHRRRLLAGIETLGADGWDMPTRCANWTTRDVVSHLVTVDGFFVATLTSARLGNATRYLDSFDPTDTPEQLVEAMRATPTAELLEQFASGQQTFIATVEAFGPEDWQSLGESPIGHVSARLVLAHAFWDSWLHERDVFEPRGMSVGTGSDEVRTATWYSLFIGATEGGLRNDSTPVGPGLEEPIDVTIAFDEFPIDALRVRIDEGVELTRGTTEATRVGSAVEFVEAFTGRRTADQFPNLPADLRAHLDRARAIL